MGYKVGTVAQGLVPSKLLALWATDAPQRAALSHGIETIAGARTDASIMLPLPHSRSSQKQWLNTYFR
jgi:hypothetical protein